MLTLWRIKSFIDNEDQCPPNWTKQMYVDWTPQPPDHLCKEVLLTFQEVYINWVNWGFCVLTTCQIICMLTFLDVLEPFFVILLRSRAQLSRMKRWRSLSSILVPAGYIWVGKDKKRHFVLPDYHHWCALEQGSETRLLGSRSDLRLTGLLPCVTV